MLPRNIFTTLRITLAKWLWMHSSDTMGHPSNAQQTEGPAEARVVSTHAVHSDADLLERSRTQWQFGDWGSLAQLSIDRLQHHPDRAKLAVLSAAGRLQMGQTHEARQYIRLALEWGVSKKLLARVLAAGVHNSLARAAAVTGDQRRAFQHFDAAISTATTGSKSRLLVQVRINHQYEDLGLLPEQVASLPDAVLPTPISQSSNAVERISTARSA